jgi:phage head maturation protease
MTSTASIRGLAIPIGRARFVGDAVEIVEAGAFEAMLARRPWIAIRWRDHGAGAPLIAMTRALFADDIGLCFEAAVRIRRAGAFAALAAATNGRAQCSVRFSAMDARREIRDGMAVRVIASAEIDEITVCDGDAVYGENAPCWRADAGANIGAAPYRIREIDRHWRAARSLAAERSRLTGCAPETAEDFIRAWNQRVVAWHMSMAGRGVGKSSPSKHLDRRPRLPELRVQKS